MIEPHDSRRFSSGFRFFCVMIGVGLLALMVVAASLEPDPRGFGTHIQLGMSPCVVRTQFGFRCPTCGMTTAWSALLHGNWSDAAHANLAGLILAVICWTWIPYFVTAGLLGRWPWPTKFYALQLPFYLVMLVTVLEWIVRQLTSVR